MKWFEDKSQTPFDDIINEAQGQKKNYYNESEYKKTQPTQGNYQNKTNYEKIYRFRLQPGQSTTIIFLDDEPYAVDEHNFRDEGGFFTTRICRGQGCPYCAKGIPKRKTWYLTVFDLGDSHKKLLAMTYYTFKKFSRLKERYEGLKWAKVQVYRDRKTSSIDDMIFLVKAPSVEAVKKYVEDINPVNYARFLK